MLQHRALEHFADGRGDGQRRAAASARRAEIDDDKVSAVEIVHSPRCGIHRERRTADDQRIRLRHMQNRRMQELSSSGS